MSVAESKKILECFTEDYDYLKAWESVDKYHQTLGIYAMGWHAAKKNLCKVCPVGAALAEEDHAEPA
jgi:hypothetical protein